MNRRNRRALWLFSFLIAAGVVAGPGYLAWVALTRNRPLTELTLVEGRYDEQGLGTAVTFGSPEWRSVELEAGARPVRVRVLGRAAGSDPEQSGFRLAVRPAGDRASAEYPLRFRWTAEGDRPGRAFEGEADVPVAVAGAHQMTLRTASRALAPLEATAVILGSPHRTSFALAGAGFLLMLLGLGGLSWTKKHAPAEEPG